MAKIEAQERGLFDVVMPNQDGFIAETSSANIFWLKNDEIYTPAKNCDIVSGTTRARLLELLPKKIRGIKLRQVRARISVLKNCDAIFLTNAANGVIVIDELILKGAAKKLEKKFADKIAQIFEDDLRN